jgi:hypothetical protein
MHPVRALLAGALLLSCACGHSRTAPFRAEFAVEFPAHSYAVVPDHGLVSIELSGDSLHPRPGVTPRTGPPITVKLDFTVQHHKVLTAVYTLPPESDPLRYDDGHKQRLASHSARLNETVELTELEQLGYQSLTLRIVTAKPDRPAPLSVISKVPSVQPREIDEDRGGYTLSLRNLSRRSVISYTMSEGDNSSGIAFSRENDSRWDPLIAPGAEKNVRIEAGSRDVAIAAALFSDGTHEGDSAAAARLKSGRIAYETQRRRATPIIERIVKDPALDDPARLARIKDELSDLSNEPEEASVRAMQREFPDVPAEVIRKDLTGAFYQARINVWSEVYAYAHASGEYPPPVHPHQLSEFLRRCRP